MSGAVVVAFTGSFAAVVVLLVVPEFLLHCTVAAVSTVVHVSAMKVADVFDHDADRPPTDEQSDGSVPLALVAIIGAVVSALLLVATGLGIAVDSLSGVPAAVAFAVAAYYPVVDVSLARRGLPSPGKVVYVASVKLAVALFGVRSSIPDGTALLGDATRRSLR